ncbi:MAG TPA: hypothetical protein VKG20_12395 [Methylomirabilota bacterium]|nr:hypothetical protein [Methylomirabilota bacterium]
MVRPSKNPAHAMRRVEEAIMPGHDKPQGQRVDPRGRGNQREQTEPEQHEPPSR